MGVGGNQPAQPARGAQRYRGLAHDQRSAADACGKFRHSCIDVAHVRPVAVGALRGADANEMHVGPAGHLLVVRGEAQPSGGHVRAQQLTQAGFMEGKLAFHNACILTGSTSTPMTSNPSSAMQAACVTPR
jgi:hypothetical protein